MHAKPAIFGKHPAWPDFMEDGLPDSGPLRQWCDALMSAIERTVTAGRWAAPGQHAPDWLIDFDHLLVWAAPGELAVARIWASADARGRRLYPLIVLQQLDPDASLQEIELASQQIEHLGDAVRAVADQESFARVRRAEAERTKLRAPESIDRNAAWKQLAQGATHNGTNNSSNDTLRAALIRALIEFDDTESLAQPTASDKGMSASQIASINHLAYALRLRVQAKPVHRAATLALLLRDALHPNNHIACITPSDPAADWADTIIGQPSPESIWTIRATPDECPLPSGPPPEPAHKVRAILETWESGNRHAAMPNNPRQTNAREHAPTALGTTSDAPARRKPGPPRKALVIVIIAAVLVLIGITAAVLRFTA